MNDKYIFETERAREMDLVVNRHVMLDALFELKEWRRLLYRNKDYNDGHYLIDNKVYTEKDLMVNKEIEKDEYGCIKNISEKFYYQKELINKLDGILRDIEELLNRNEY